MPARFGWRGLSQGGVPASRGRDPLLAFLAALPPSLPLFPALLGESALRVLGMTPRGEVPEFVDSWLRGVAGILVLTPALMCYSRKLAEWGAVSTKGAPPHSISGRNVLELGVETAVWGVALWMAVEFKVRYGLNITYLTFLPPLGLTLLRGMHAWPTWRLPQMEFFGDHALEPAALGRSPFPIKRSPPTHYDLLRHHSRPGFCCGRTRTRG